MHSLSPEAARLSRGDRLFISVCILLIIGLAWAYLIHLDRQMSASMDYETMMRQMGMTTDWTATDSVFTFVMWTVMMVGMMAGTAAPMLMLFANAHAGRRQGGARLAVLMFGVGYITVWVGFSGFAALAQWALHRAAMLSPAMAASNTRLSSMILIGAGAYQLSSWKSKCLTHCRSPLGFLMTHWRDGKIGALDMGVRHGAYCLGCCWALMCVLFVVGVMNLVWVAILTVFVLLEKIGPAGVIVARVAGVVMVVFGIVLIAR